MRYARAALALCLAGCALVHEIPRDSAVDAPPVTRVLLPCASSGMSGPGRDCGWTSGGGVACRPGATIRIGCAAGCGLGSCSGDSIMRVCDTAPCLASQALAFDDDSSCGGLCPFIDGVTCPGSGELFVLTGPFSAGAPYTCAFVVR